MSRERARYNLERQYLAQALRKHFSDEAVGKMMGISRFAVHHLCTYHFKGKIPTHSEIAIGESVGEIFATAMQAGERAIIQCLREAADALERGMESGSQKIKDAEL